MSRGDTLLQYCKRTRPTMMLHLCVRVCVCLIQFVQIKYGPWTCLYFVFPFVVLFHDRRALSVFALIVSRALLRAYSPKYLCENTDAFRGNKIYFIAYAFPSRHSLEFTVLSFFTYFFTAKYFQQSNRYYQLMKMGTLCRCFYIYHGMSRCLYIIVYIKQKSTVKS